MFGAYSELDTRLADSRFLLGDNVTLADVRLWVTLVRHDAAAARTGTRRLSDFPNLWRYARDMYSLDAFRVTTDFASFGASDAVVDDWKSPITSSASAHLGVLMAAPIPLSVLDLLPRSAGSDNTPLYVTPSTSPSAPNNSDMPGTGSPSIT